MTIASEHLLVELRAELRKVTELRVSIEALITVVSDTRDELIRSRIVNEEVRDTLRDVRDSLRSKRRKA